MMEDPQLLQSMIDARNVYKMKAEQMYVIEGIQDILIFHICEKTLEGGHYKPMNISPEALYSLIMNWAAGDDAASVESPYLKHVSCNIKVFDSHVTANTRRGAKITTGFTKKLQYCTGSVIAWTFKVHHTPRIAVNPC